MLGMIIVQMVRIHGVHLKLTKQMAQALINQEEAFLSESSSMLNKFIMT